MLGVEGSNATAILGGMKEKYHVISEIIEENTHRSNT
jgi:hypothetical protein